MWDVIVKLYQDPSENRKMILKEKLGTTNMQKGGNVTSHLIRIQGVWNELAVVGEKPKDSELVQTTINVFSKNCQTFVQEITGWDNLPNWEHLWSDFTQEELRLSLVEGSTSNNRKGSKVENEDENFALASKAKGKKGKGKCETSQKSDKKEDLSKIKCFQCHEFGHYATKCSNRKKGSNKEHVVASAEVDGFAS